MSIYWFFLSFFLYLFIYSINLIIFLHFFICSHTRPQVDLVLLYKIWVKHEPFSKGFSCVPFSKGFWGETCEPFSKGFCGETCGPFPKGFCGETCGPFPKGLLALFQKPFFFWLDLFPKVLADPGLGPFPKAFGVTATCEPFSKGFSLPAPPFPKRSTAPRSSPQPGQSHHR